jgi:hypothetical protein
MWHSEKPLKTSKFPLTFFFEIAKQLTISVDLLTYSSFHDGSLPIGQAALVPQTFTINHGPIAPRQKL